MDMKQQVREYIINDQKQRIAELKQLLVNINAQSDIEEASVIDPEDLTHQSEATDMRLIQQARLVEAEDELLYMENINTDSTDKVGLGNLVKTDTFAYYVGMPCQPFQLEGKDVVGISIHSPIYAAMVGKHKGEKFSFNDKTYSILDIV